MIDVKSEVKIHEINNEKVECFKHKLAVLSHWNEDDKIILQIEDKKYTINAYDLQKAIENATNINRFP